ATLVIFALGRWSTAQVTAGQDDHDPSEVVIDEVAGQWIALLPVSFGAAFMGAEVLRRWPGIVAGFVLFRLFDIWMPGPIGKA
ncbi:phosphatidylglycerophosphatase A family protein, partial [Marinovum sp. 1_MG-2023]|uniref:phosphatidylglycerophosphatase A family protein n=1 Tax=Marinovum sp. 1_MG-2023 TaxID=3062633 RepID=UPI0026E36A1B